MEEFLNKNLQEIYTLIDNADVLAVGFLRIQQRLLVDTRYDPADPPMIKVVEQVASVEERLKNLQRMRPRFQSPERFTFFMWPLSVSSLESLGIWERILNQCYKSSYATEVEEQGKTAIDELRSLERRETFEAIAGPRYRSIWERKR